MHEKTLLVEGDWVEGTGGILQSVDPSTGEVFWQGRAASKKDVDQAVASARGAFESWSQRSVGDRDQIISRFVDLVEERAEEVAAVISRDNGKPLWEARTEVTSLVTKLAATREAFEVRASDRVQDVKGRKSVTRFRPHGVLVVLGPFNFPTSMPNSHVLPALYAGNTVVLKPSDRTPAAGRLYAELWRSAGLPAGVLNLVQGGPEVGSALVAHPDIDGVLFIGSYRAGMSISRALQEAPHKQLTLEMGGNGPLVIWDYDDVRLAVHVAIQSGFLSTGQRCTAARRLIVNKSVSEEFIAALTAATRSIAVGPSTQEPQPFMGPLISDGAARKFLEDVEVIRAAGGRFLVTPSALDDLGGAFVSPGLVDTTGVVVPDEEVFGPLLQIQVAESLDDAIGIANDTKYGLAAGIVAIERPVFEQFLLSTKAGIVNWNQPLTGATTFAPFGGVKASGNFRPAGYLSVDYCSYATASIEDENPAVPDSLPPGVSY